jgi:hypothetical protein
LIPSKPVDPKKKYCIVTVKGGDIGLSHHQHYRMDNKIVILEYSPVVYNIEIKECEVLFNSIHTCGLIAYVILCDPILNLYKLK